MSSGSRAKSSGSGRRARTQAAATIPVYGVFGRRRRDVEPARAAAPGFPGRKVEEAARQSLPPPVPADVKEHQLQRIAGHADRLAVEDGDADEGFAGESGEGHAAAIQRGLQQRAVGLRFPGRPAGHVEVVRFEEQRPVHKAVDAVDELSPVDLPHPAELVASEATDGHRVVRHPPIPAAARPPGGRPRATCPGSPRRRGRGRHRGRWRGPGRRPFRSGCGTHRGGRKA